MELKDNQDGVIIILYHQLNPFNGIESVSVASGSMYLASWNPFNGIESFSVTILLAISYLTNPFNGIERHKRDARPGKAEERENPFNGIERRRGGDVDGRRHQGADESI